MKSRAAGAGIIAARRAEGKRSLARAPRAITLRRNRSPGEHRSNCKTRGTGTFFGGDHFPFATGFRPKNEPVPDL